MGSECVFGGGYAIGDPQRGRAEEFLGDDARKTTRNVRGDPQREGGVLRGIAVPSSRCPVVSQSRQRSGR